MTKYRAYTESSMSFVGAIPAHWKLVKLKYIVSTKICDGPHETPEFVETGIPFMSAEGIKDNKIDLNFKRGFITREQHREYSKKSKVYKNDILFCKSGSTTGKSAMVDIDEEFGIWSPLAIIRADSRKIVPSYLFFSITSDFFKLQVETAWTFGTQPNIGMNALENLQICMPSLGEQIKIASFLNYKIPQIDKLINDKKKLIELLKEERTAIINQATTKGLKLDVPMRESSVDYLDKIPEHWDIKKLKYIADINSLRNNYLFERNSNQEVIFLPMEKVTENGEINQETKKKIAEVSSGFTYFEKGDVIVAKITPCFENGKGALLSSLETDFGFGSTEFHTLRAKLDIDSKFLYYLTKSERFMTIGEAFMTGAAGQKRIPTNFLKEFKIGLPPLKEQLEIVKHIEQQKLKIDSTITDISKEILLLKEYKTALISEVVTGKVDVQNEIIPETSTLSLAS